MTSLKKIFFSDHLHVKRNCIVFSWVNENNSISNFELSTLNKSYDFTKNYMNILRKRECVLFSSDSVLIFT